MFCQAVNLLAYQLDPLLSFIKTLLSTVYSRIHLVLLLSCGIFVVSFVMTLMFIKDPPFWLVRTQISTNSVLPLGIFHLTGIQSSSAYSCDFTLQLVLTYRWKRTPMQILSIFYIAHSSHPSLSKLLFLSPQLSSTTMFCLVVQEVPQTESWHFDGAYCTCFPSLRGHGTALPVAQYREKSCFVYFCLVFQLFTVGEHVQSQLLFIYESRSN